MKNRWRLNIEVGYKEIVKTFDEIAEVFQVARLIADARDEDGNPINVTISPIVKDGEADV